ncbi:MCE family protein [Mycolicibacterium sp. CBMA 226]|uniref:MCE family protein n=1 Tax=Mycolicibacterium sp. CBMA 226 TaxID=2606611 RepID=UPI0013089600|nr:MCE family protein [Mycolicibacterium sp. CBMA 226]MUL74544.1 MCE family protein [Mycolicibacterium sp. CBMA 226]
MLTRLIRVQLAIFSVVAVIVIVAVALFYLHVPAALGFGVYNVTANFTSSGGLYRNANVTYRGTTIGHVTAVSLTHGHGVDAAMQLDSDTAIPADVTASVKSMSAIGELYIDLVPPPNASAESLRNGSRIDRAHTQIPGDIAGLLHEAQALIDSLDNSRLHDLLHETFKAFDGTGPELARLIESARLLVDEADRYTGDTTALIDQAGPFLDAQIQSGDSIKSIADGLARLSTEARRADPEIRAVLQAAPGAAAAATETFEGIRPSFPVLAANLANFGRIGVIYHKSIEQTLVVFPALTAVLLTVAQQLPGDEGAKADFKFNLGDPPPCLTGFIPPPDQRTPADQTLRDIPPDLYCKVAQNDPTAVRGARNYPCQEFPGKRAPTVDLCRDPAGYVPIGNNPWRGPPVPYDTPVTDPRNILPPNKYPNIPPEADYDPGPPVVQLPPGVPPGPGPALTPPFPSQTPPVTRGPQPPPLPFRAPPDQQVPPYGQVPAGAAQTQPWPPPAPDSPAPLPAESPSPAGNGQPQASGPGATTYDPGSGQFLDPNGGISVFAAGTLGSTAETWVDLMKGPRQS